MRVGRHNKPVTLWRSPQTSGDSDGFLEALSPSTWWAGIEPFAPGEGGRTVQHVVTMRYHPQVSVDTVVIYLDPTRRTEANLTGSRQLFVRGFQNVGEQNAEMRLLAEEVIP